MCAIPERFFLLLKTQSPPHIFFCRGLCSVFRSKAGQMTAGENDRHEEEKGEEEASSTNFLHNSHWIKDPHHSGPSRYVGYYDAASLYPSSSEFFFLQFLFLF